LRFYWQLLSISTLTIGNLIVKFTQKNVNNLSDKTGRKITSPKNDAECYDAECYDAYIAFITL
jgi:hypothetical protein